MNAHELFTDTLNREGKAKALAVGLRIARNRASKAAAWEWVRRMKELEPLTPDTMGDRGWPNWAVLQQFVDAYIAQGHASAPQRFINLTPHYVDTPVGSFVPSRLVARRETAYTATGRTHGGISLDTKTFAETTGLPEPQEGVMYIVSDLVRMAHPERKDICSPGRPRYKDGHKNGCATFVVNP